jgi:hypothetical protein
MNWWMVAGGTMALICAVGHAIAGPSMFFWPIKSDLRSEFTPLCSAQCGASSRSISRCRQLHSSRSARGHGNIVASLIAAQFAVTPRVYLILSLRLGRALKLFQWMPFGATAILSALGAITVP